MSMFFDDKKKVSLSGKGNKGRTQETKQDFLERTRREREAREVQRRREKAALDVQAFMRGRRAARQRRSASREGWDEELQSLAANWARCPESSPSPPALAASASSLLRRLLFFYSAQTNGDDDRLTAFGLWVLRGNGAGRKGLLLLCEGLSSTSLATAEKAGPAYLQARRVRSLALLSLGRLRRLASQNAKAGDVHALDCSILLTLSNRNLLGHNVLQHRSFVGDLLQHGLMKIVGMHLKCCITARGTLANALPYEPAEENLQLLLITLTVNVLAIKDEEAPSNREATAAPPATAAADHAAAWPSAAACDAVEQFSRHVLTIREVLRPGVLSTKGRLVLLGLSGMGHDGDGNGARRLWVACLSSLSRDNGALSSRLCHEESLEAVSFLLGNLVELSEVCLQHSTAHMRGLFAICVSRLLAHVRQVKHQRLEAGDVEMEDEDDDMEIESEHVQVQVETAAGLTWVTQTKSRVRTTGTSHLPPALLSVRQHVQALCNHEYVDKLLDVVQSAANEPGGAGAVGSTCGLVLQLLDFIPEAKTGVLNALAFKPAVLTMFWRILVLSLSSQAELPASAKTVAGSLVDASQGASRDMDLDHMQQESLLTMFCMVYEYFLMTADNDDFYVRQYPFQLDQVRDMVNKLKLVIYPMYTSRPGAHPPPPPGALSGGTDNATLNDSFSGSGLDESAGNSGRRIRLSESAKQLRTAGTKLLNRLFERNCYREYMSPDEWLAPQWAIGSVESALDAALAQRLSDPNDPVSLLSDMHMQVLQKIPFSLPFPLRVRVFRNFIYQDRSMILDGPHEWVHGRVRRARVLSDSYEELNPHGPNLKRTVQIQFVNHEGLTEAGIDGGGLFKEFINTLAGQAFNPEYGLFKCTEQELLFPNPQAESANPFAETINSLQLFEFIGRIIGKAIYDGILIELRLAPFFLRKMLGKEMYFDDLESLDADLYKNLLWTVRYTGDYADLALNFEVNENVLGSAVSTELIPGGRDMLVTASNVLQYKALITDYWLNRRIAQQSRALMRGLADLIRPDWIRMFSPDELQMVISGSVQELDLNDLRSNCNYGGGYHDNHPSVETFWRVVDGFDRKQREDLLKFVTSCSRPPLLGFRELHPPFCIQKTSHSAEEANLRLPTASTCMNLLKLPSYDNADACRDRVLYAISAGAGFELS